MWVGQTYMYAVISTLTKSHLYTKNIQIDIAAIGQDTLIYIGFSCMRASLLELVKNLPSRISNTMYGRVCSARLSGVSSVTEQTRSAI